MLVDINAYVGHWPFQQFRITTCEKLLEKMDQYGAEVSVVSHLHGLFYKNTQSANEELVEELKSNRRFRDRFIPFAVINPTYGGWREDFETCISKFGMKGLRLYPKYHNYDLKEPALIELVKRARDRGLPVAFKIRMVDSRTTSWMDIPYIFESPQPEWDLKDVVPIVRAVPDAKFIILNVANSMALSDDDTALFKKADLVFDTSGKSISNLGALIKTFGKEKFAWGTHSPILDYLTGLLRIESLRATEANEATKELIRSGNAKRIIGV
ncbi:MAG: amidohydrolase [Opitutus sp.]|nr:amidohydrolase [Opitutus sp.]